MPRRSKRTDEKLGLILGQVTSLRGRLNSLAFQQGFFRAAAILIAAGAITYLAAFALSPLWFLAIGAAIALAIATGLWGAIRRAWRMRANLVRAAELADERAGLRGRLVTIVQTPLATRRSPLWAYLVEDTLERREQFVPSAIERRRISRSLFAFAGALALAAILIPSARFVHPARVAPVPAQGDITLDLNDLQIRPAEPGDEPGVELQADAATMRKLDSKLGREAAAASGAGNPGSINNLLSNARKFAGNVQQRVRGGNNEPARLTLHLSDPGPQPNSANQGSEPWRTGRQGEESGQFEHDRSNSNGEPLPPPDPKAHDLASSPTRGEGSASASENGGNSSARENSSQSHDPSGQANADGGSNGGAMHGVGADPGSLFGAPADSRFGAEGFEIAIEARPMEKGAKGAGHAYVPPKVRAPLSARQQPDEPVVRGEVPADDRTTIRQVFER